MKRISFNLISFGLITFSGFILLSSCNDSDDIINKNTDTISAGPYANGIFITNEGTFGNNNGSVSFYSTVADTHYSIVADTVYNSIFSEVNGRILGDVVQSICINDSLAYIVVNNSNKIEIVSRYTFEEAGVFPNLPSPRYMVTEENIGFVSCWGDNSVHVLNLKTLTDIKSIETGSGPEKMLKANGKIYVTNTGGFAYDSLVTVIDIETQKVVKNINVKYVPNDMVIDKDGFIWVLAAGRVIYNTDWSIAEQTPCKLYKINSSTDEVSDEITLWNEQHPTNLEIDNTGSTLYIGGGYAFGGIFSLPIGSTTPVEFVDDWAYGFNIDSESNVVFVMVAPNFTSAGWLKRYKTDGTLLGEYICGIGPSSASFKHSK